MRLYVYAYKAFLEKHYKILDITKCASEDIYTYSINRRST